MADIQISAVRKSYGKVPTLHGIDLAFASGEFVVILGPSGCGKSTLLRMIAGLEEITAGEIAINGRVVNRLEPRERGCAMVFQNYALYPHMTVAGNIGYALKVAGIPKAERLRRIEETAKIVGLSDYLNRKPAALSGGQRQRVAMGRALVRDPSLFLFDEPLSNLDAKLRVSMRTEIKKLHQDLNASIVYVTHDQIEAMTLATKIVVMKGGVIQQIGTPAEIYNKPANMFVADFMGSPAMNLIPARVRSEAGRTRIEIERANAAPLVITDPVARNLPAEIVLGVRPEDIHEATGNAHLPGTAQGAGGDVMIEIVEPAGADTFAVTHLGGKPVTARLRAESAVQARKPFPLAFDLSKVSYFSPTDGERLN